LQPLSHDGSNGGAHSQALCQTFHSAVLECALIDQPEARETVFEVPTHAGVPGKHFGRQRGQGRKPFLAAAAQNIKRLVRFLSQAQAVPATN
jgi:hypothetical protein